MTDAQFQALIAWFNRFDMRLEAIERRLARLERPATSQVDVVSVRWLEPPS